MWYVLCRHRFLPNSDRDVEPAMFVAAFNDEDPGVDQVAQRCTCAMSCWPIALTNGNNSLRFASGYC